MDYRIRMEMMQDQTGSENAKVKITIGGTVVAAEQEITTTDMENPQILDYVVTGLDAPASDTTVDIKVELLNDEYVDADTDRNACICQVLYSYKQDGFTEWSLPVRWEPTDGGTVEDKNVEWDFSVTSATNYGVLRNTWNNITMTDASEDQGTGWATGQSVNITYDHVEFSMPLTETYPTAKDTAFFVPHNQLSSYTLLD